jgi:hypothetical protein
MRPKKLQTISPLVGSRLITVLRFKPIPSL